MHYRQYKRIDQDGSCKEAVGSKQYTIFTTHVESRWWPCKSIQDNKSFNIVRQHYMHPLVRFFELAPYKLVIMKTVLAADSYSPISIIMTSLLSHPSITRRSVSAAVTATPRVRRGWRSSPCSSPSHRTRLCCLRQFHQRHSTPDVIRHPIKALRALGTSPARRETPLHGHRPTQASGGGPRIVVIMTVPLAPPPRLVRPFGRRLEPELQVGYEGCNLWQHYHRWRHETVGSFLSSQHGVRDHNPLWNSLSRKPSFVYWSNQPVTWAPHLAGDTAQTLTTTPGVHYLRYHHTPTCTGMPP